MEGTRRVRATGTRPKIVVSADGRGVVGPAGARLVADVAEATGLTGRFGDVLAVLRQRRGGHDPGRVAVDLAVVLADGGQASPIWRPCGTRPSCSGRSPPTRPPGDCCPN
jgi:hypothetical protein